MQKKLKCQNCGHSFTGRSNRLYCSITCRRAAERGKRETKRRAAMLEAMTADERVFYEGCMRWQSTIPTEEELFGDLPTLEDAYGGILNLTPVEMFFGKK